MLTLALILMACQPEAVATPPEVGASAPPAAPPAPRQPTTAPSPTVEAAVIAAKTYMGKHYEWAGRDTAKNPGIDCLGLLFLGYGAATGTPWRKYPVNPSQIVASGRLGAPVPGLDGVARADIDWGLLRRGDVLYFLNEGYEIKDAPLWVRTDGAKFWPWHTGMYIDEGKGLALHASPWSGVIEEPLEDVPFDALFVTRLEK